jgi:uncharacterized protein
VPRIPDGPKSFVVTPGQWRAMRYEGSYCDGVRNGVWRVTDAGTGDHLWETTWSAGEWHGPARSWYRSGHLEHDGEYSHGQRTGVWMFWFESGQLGAQGAYEDDRKVGGWQYWGQDGQPMSYERWEREYHEWDWAYDDYTGFPRGENWPEPPSDSAS